MVLKDIICNIAYEVVRKKDKYARRMGLKVWNGEI
jgi:hypothetical protein